MHTKKGNIYICKDLYMSGLLISLWVSDNPLFVCDKYVAPTGKRYHLTQQLAAKNTCMWLNSMSTYMQDKYVDSTV